MKHKEQSEYVDRTQRQYETALTRVLKIKTTLQHKLSLAILCLKQAAKNRRKNMTRKRISRIINTVIVSKLKLQNLASKRLYCRVT